MGWAIQQGIILSWVPPRTDLPSFSIKKTTTKREETREKETRKGSIKHEVHLVKAKRIECGLFL